ncbi:WAS/WASL-interacting protein family member 3-like [Takifugu flavidus]|uniref:WAS/WASL-interacting protein family member 3-like n=1 Tax=Takifugu flavidus TaxID=433684 RepID=UPI0025442459|nr:WAS/WASL-interacting protein family member 3-like [Takifugu flavidus]
MLSLKISFVSAGLSKSYAAGSRIAQDKSFSPQHSKADIAKKVLHGQNSDIMNKLRRKAPPPPPSPPPPPPPAPTFLSTYIGEGGCITIGYDPHFPPPPSSILPVLNEEQYCPITLESRRGVNLNKVDTPSSELDINKVQCHNPDIKNKEWTGAISPPSPFPPLATKHPVEHGARNDSFFQCCFSKYVSACWPHSSRSTGQRAYPSPHPQGSAALKVRQTPVCSSLPPPQHPQEQGVCKQRRRAPLPPLPASPTLHPLQPAAVKKRRRAPSPPQTPDLLNLHTKQDDCHTVPRDPSFPLPTPSSILLAMNEVPYCLHTLDEVGILEKSREVEKQRCQMDIHPAQQELNPVPEDQNPDTKKKVMQRAPSPPLPSPFPPLHPQEPAATKIWEMPPPPPDLPPQSETMEDGCSTVTHDPPFPPPPSPILFMMYERGHQFQSCETEIDAAWQTLLKQIQDGVKLKPVANHFNSVMTNTLKKHLEERRKHICPPREDGDSDEWDD